MPFSDKTRAALGALNIDHGGSHDDAAEPLDLRAIPVEQWEPYLCYPVLLPPHVNNYIGVSTNPSKPPPLTTLEKDHLEEAIETFHNVHPPWAIVLRDGVARLMKE